jgi:hypothetical protein
MDVLELAPGLWRWTARHPEWGPDSNWPPEVGCFYAEAEDATLVIDPLIPRDEEERFWRSLDGDVERRGVPVAVLLTCAPHARDAGETALRYGGDVWGHADAAAKVGDARFHATLPGDVLPGGVRALSGDMHGTGDTPLYVPSHRAVAVGDALLEVGGELRVWCSDAKQYREQLPELRRWLELELDHVLVAHGEQLPGGRELLAAALERPPY